MPAVRFVGFDIGGVLVRIYHRLGEAAASAGISIRPGTEDTPLTMPILDDYQAGQIDLETFCTRMAEFLGTSRGDALRVLEAIIQEPYDGSLQLVLDLNAAGYRTGCLSNTNEVHWRVLNDAARFPAIAALDLRMASHLEGVQKPDVALFQRFCERAGVAPGEVLFFDDAPKNLAAAIECGMKAELVDASGDTAAQMREILRQRGLLIG